MDWNEKNKEFIKQVQKVIGCNSIDGLAGNETITKFNEFVKKQNNDGEAIKKAWNDFLSAIK